jgi:hypothetical protein
LRRNSTQAENERWVAIAVKARPTHLVREELQALSAWIWRERLQAHANESSGEEGGWEGTSRDMRTTAMEGAWVLAHVGAILERW